MKAYHFFIILAIVLGVWFYICHKKENKSKKEDKSSDNGILDNNPALDPNLDYSENADVATISYEDALAIEEKYENCMLWYEPEAEDPKWKYKLTYIDEEDNFKVYNEIISKKTFDTLVSLGYESDCN